MLKKLRILIESNKKRKRFKQDSKEEEEFLNIDVSIKNLIIFLSIIFFIYRSRI